MKIILFFIGMAVGAFIGLLGRIMARYINADKLRNEIKDLPEQERIELMGIDDVIRNQPPADVQEVIYCKNCKNYCKFKNGDVVCEEFGGYIKDNDFCSRGERKDGK